MRMDTGPSDDELHPVSDLHPETIVAVADRTATATTFEDLVYREAEIDALWTLVDIQVTVADRNGSDDLARWMQLRDLLWQAHEHIAEGRADESAATLRSMLTVL